jgi:Tol biopolymer transport system component
MNLFKNSWHTLVKTALGILLISALAQQAAFAQFRVEVSGVGLTRIPIAFAQFRDEGLSPQPISKIVGSDLERSGHSGQLERMSLSMRLKSQT